VVVTDLTIKMVTLELDLKQDHQLVVAVLELLKVVLVDKVHGVTVLLQVLVAVVQVCFTMVSSSLVLAVEAVAVDQVVDSTVVEPLMVAILVVIIEMLLLH
jgi:hypothetical protein